MVNANGSKVSQEHSLNASLCTSHARLSRSYMHTSLPTQLTNSKHQKDTKRKNALGWNRTSVLVAHLTVDSRTPLTGLRHPRRPPAMFRMPLWIDHVITTRLPGLVFGLMTVLRVL